MQQMEFFEDVSINSKKRSGTFIDNMKLPIHRWFKYSAGYSAEWVSSLLENTSSNSYLILDPFVGSGTTLLASDNKGIRSIGIESHPFIYKVASAKINWNIDVQDFSEFVREFVEITKSIRTNDYAFPDLIIKCFSESNLTYLNKLRLAYNKINDNSSNSNLLWLAITAILRNTSHVGTAQWQYILPNKKKKKVTSPNLALQLQIEQIKNDIEYFKNNYKIPRSKVILGDARELAKVDNNSIDFVITSPPYANNYDYADATRFEMSFWGEINNWGDLHESVRKYLITSSSQHASKDKLELSELLKNDLLYPISDEISVICNKLSEERHFHGGKKHYHTMIAQYFIDLSKVFKSLYRVSKNNAKMCFVIGDSAPYGIYVPVERWLGDLAVYHGFNSYHFEKIRDRNIKWKNRKHNVPLKEGRLWIYS